jgi:hypothetical protein
MLLSMLGPFFQVQKSLLLVSGVGKSEVRKKGAEQIQPHQQLGSTFARVLESERERTTPEQQASINDHACCFYLK